MINAGSINTMRAPVDYSRDVHARFAGHVLYNSVSRSNSGQSSSLLNSTAATDITLPEDQRACCGIMSPVRRTFCLVLLFDLVLAFLLWVIYTQVLDMSIKVALRDEVLNYKFETSMFDTVMCAMCRFVPLLLAYALFRLRHPWPIAVCTFATCVYLICKVFIFEGPADGPDEGGSGVGGKHKNYISYVLLVVSFVITWLETWFLDFKVLPREAKAREREALYRSINEHTYDDLGSGYPTREEYYSPNDSRAGSDDELLEDHDCEDNDDDFKSLPGTRSHSRKSSFGGMSFNITLGDQEQEYRDLASQVWDDTWDMAHEEDGWKLEAGTDDETGCIKTKHFPNIGKVYKMQGYVDCNPKVMFQELVFRVSDQPTWNPTVLETRVVHIIDNNTDILYNVAAESAGGVISSRDFVNIRRWGMREGVYVSVGIGVTHHQIPEVEKHVRGKNGPGIFVFRAVPEDPNRCHYSCLINTDLKGWIPQYIIDQAMAGVLMAYFKAIRKHMADVINNPPV